VIKLRGVVMFVVEKKREEEETGRERGGSLVKS